MTAGVQRRIGQHGDAQKFDAIQQTSATVSAAPSPAGLATPVHMEAELIHFIAFCRRNGIIGADQIAHGAPDAFVSRIGFLANAVIDLKFVCRLLGHIKVRMNLPFSKNPQFNGVNRTDGCALAAQGTFIFMP